MRFSPKCLLGLIFPALLFGTVSDRVGSPISQSQVSGLKMVVRHKWAGMPSEQTTYVAGDRRRMDFRNSTAGAKHSDGSVDVRYGPHIAYITRCDLGQMLELNLDAREYQAAPYPPKPLAKEQTEARGLTQQAPMPSQPTLLIETTTVDTGERNEMFGHQARHVITTRKETPLEDSQAQAQESVTDGWYVDLDDRISCDLRFPPGRHAFVRVSSSDDHRAPELPKFVDTGKPESGFAIEKRVISRSVYALPDGTKKQSAATTETIITQLEEGPLDADVFEVPTGFRQVAQVETNPPDGQTAAITAWERLKARVERLLD